MRDTQMLYRLQMAAVTIAILASVFLADRPYAQSHDMAGDRPASIFDPQPDGAILEHDPVVDPASLDGVAAERVYRAILPQMQAAYAASGDPLAVAYATWRRHNTVPYLSHQHGRIFVNNYANDVAAAYGQTDLTGPLPEGSMIVKDSFIVTDVGDIRVGALAIMEKMAAGYDPPNGDWRYIVVGPDGMVSGVSVAAGGDPQMRQCAACHNAAPQGRDRLFLTPEAVRR